MYDEPFMFLTTILFGIQAGSLLASQGLAVSPNGRWLATSHGDHRITVFDLRTTTARTLSYKPSAESLYPMLRDPAFSRDSSMLTSGTVSPDDGASPLWSTRTWKLLNEIAVWRSTLSADGLRQVQFSRSGRLVYGILARPYDPSLSEQPIYAIDVRTGQIRFLNTLNCLAMAADPVTEGMILKNGAGYRLFNPLEDWASDWGSSEDAGFEWIYQGIAPRSDGARIATCTGDKVKTVLRIYTRDVRKPSEGFTSPTPAANIALDGFAVRAMTWIPVHDSILLAGLDGQVRIVDPTSKKIVATWAAPDKQHLRGCAASPDGRRAYVGGDLGVIYELSARDLSRRRTFSVKRPASER